MTMIVAQCPQCRSPHWTPVLDGASRVIHVWAGAKKVADVRLCVGCGTRYYALEDGVHVFGERARSHEAQQAKAVPRTEPERQPIRPAVDKDAVGMNWREP